MTHHIWSPSWGQAPTVSALWVRLQKLQFGVPAYNPRMQTDSQSVSKLQLWLGVNAVGSVM